MDSAWGTYSLLWSLVVLLIFSKVLPSLVLLSRTCWRKTSGYVRYCSLPTWGVRLIISSVSRLVSTVWGVGFSWPSPSSVGERIVLPGSDEGVEPSSPEVAHFT